MTDFSAKCLDEAVDRANRHYVSRGWSTQGFVSDLQQTLAESL